MATYRTSISTPMSPEQAFDYLADFENITEWDENTESSDCLGEDTSRAGARYRVVTRFGGRTMTLTYETVEFERPSRVVFRSSTPIATIEDTITVAPEGDGAVVGYEANIRLKGVSRVLDPVFSLVFGRVGDRAADGLKAALKGR